MIKNLLYFVVFYVAIQFSWDVWFVVVGAGSGWTAESFNAWKQDWSMMLAVFVFVIRCIVGYVIANSLARWATNEH